VGADCQGARFLDADLSHARLERANLINADLRRANLQAANCAGTMLTGAHLHGAVMIDCSLDGAHAEWIDLSTSSDQPLRRASLVEALQPSSIVATAPTVRRYFGEGDVLRNAELDFGDGAQVEVQSHFEHCTIRLGKDTELVIGAAGRLVDCTVEGGRLRVLGKFVERRSPALIGTSQLFVSGQGALVATVQQPPEATRFAFERGCRLRMQIIPAGEGKQEKRHVRARQD
jgi:hypothetical protein